MRGAERERVKDCAETRVVRGGPEVGVRAWGSEIGWRGGLPIRDSGCCVRKLRGLRTKRFTSVFHSRSIVDQDFLCNDVVQARAVPERKCGWIPSYPYKLFIH